MKKFRSWLWRWFWRSAVIFFTLLILYQVWLFAHICWWVKYNPSSSSFMETRLEIMDLLTQSIEVLEEVYHPQGYNAGLNLGEAAGAGITGHIHLHVVPRHPGSDPTRIYTERQFEPIALGEQHRVAERIRRALA